MKFPATIFTVYGQCKVFGWIHIGDFHTEIDAAADAMVDALDRDYDAARVIRTDFDVETGAPETVRDVTEEAKAESRMWLMARGDSIPDYLVAT